MPRDQPLLAPSEFAKYLFDTISISTDLYIDDMFGSCSLIIVLLLFTKSPQLIRLASFTLVQKPGLRAQIPTAASSDLSLPEANSI
jgi:hypothetical protein